MSDAFPVTIFHNPACGTSRNTLAMIRAAGYAPQVVEYVKAGWTREQLQALAAATGEPLRALLRDKTVPADQQALLAPAVGDDALLDAMVANPLLVNRPIVQTPKGAALCRPSERVLDLLERAPDAFTKEDGEVVPLERALETRTPRLG